MKFRIFLSVLGLAGVVLQPVMADAPDKSLIPVLRPDTQLAPRPDTMVIVTQAPGIKTSLRPYSRPLNLTTGQITQSVPEVQLAMARRNTNTNRTRGICGVSGIQGQNLARIPGRLRGCGIKSPVRVTSVAGVSLSHPSTMNCTTAKALNTWVGNSVVPIIGRLGGGVTSLQVIADYSCRTRNNRPGAKISEHGKGAALDISGFNLKNGTTLDVKSGWNTRGDGKILKNLHRAACGPFGTVLGPNSDRFHQDHFHVDTASYRGGSYCR